MTDLDKLRNDRDVIDLPGGERLRLRIEPDPDTTFDDHESYGTLAPLAFNIDTGRSERPPGFDGNAAKLFTDFGDGFWWQPPRGDYEVRRDDPGFAKFRQLVIELASYGWHSVALEVLCGEDAYGQPIVVRVASLSGIDSLADGNLASVIGDLAEELDLGDD